MRTAVALTAWITVAHLALAELLTVPDWAWHHQGGSWQARAIVDGMLVLAVFGWWAPVPAGILAGAAFAQSLSHLAHFSAPVRRLHLWCLGDMLSGDIHEELSSTNDRPGAQAAVDFGHELARFVEELVPEFETIHLAGVPGNHPRATKKQQAKDAHNNGDWVAYKVAEALLAKHPSISCSFPPASYAVASVAERWRVLLMHGDGIRSTMPGVPWGGVVRRVTVLEQQFAAAKQPLDYVVMGHFHTANALDGVGIETFLNGSVKGLDEYSLKAFGSGRRPQQRLLTFHPKHGVTGMRWLNLTDHEPAQGIRAAA